MVFKNKTTQKIISSLVILAVLSPAFIGFVKPKKADAFLDPVVAFFTKLTSVFTASTAADGKITTAIALKNVAKEVVRQTLMAVAKRALADITRSTVNWINTGYFGTPLFLERPDSFLKDIAKSEIKDFIRVTGYNPTTFPFGRQGALNVIGAYNRQLEDNLRYSLSYLSSDPIYLGNYQANFNIGGWNGFLLHTQYPQNNPYGYYIESNRELAARVEGTYQPPAVDVQTRLQQGLGFLSPQVCPISVNPSYDNSLGNAFSRPSFKFVPPSGLVPPKIEDFTDIITGEPDRLAFDNARISYENQLESARGSQRSTWAQANECGPGNSGLTNTTPGSVAGNQIMQALGARQNMTELQAALGGSLSAIFDAVINKFLGAGLNALASTINKSPASDTWDYEGYTLGGPRLADTDPFSGPDQEVVLSDFKKRLSGRTIVRENSVIVEDLAGNATGQTVTTSNGTLVFSGTNRTVSITRNGTTTSGVYEYVPGDIENTEAELALMDNSNPSNYGLAQMFSLIWPKTRELDICLPGPDYGWENRLQDELDRNTTRLQQKISDNNITKSTNAAIALKDLRFAVAYFKDWVTTKMISTLPSGILFLDAVNEIEDLEPEVQTFNKRKRELTLSLVRLKAIETSLIPFSTQPTPGSQQEKDLITIKKQYDSGVSAVSSSLSIENVRTTLESAKNKFQNLQKLVGTCTAERQAKGWTVPAKWDTPVGNTNISILPSEAGKVYVRAEIALGNPSPPNIDIPAQLRGFWKLVGIFFTTTGREREQFCDLPIIAGYTHGDIVLQYPNAGFKSYQLQSPPLNLPLVNGRVVVPMLDSGDKSPININISCKILYTGSIIDYKGSIFGDPNISAPIDPPPDPTDIIPFEPDENDTGGGAGGGTGGGDTGGTGTTGDCGGPGQPVCG